MTIEGVDPYTPRQIAVIRRAHVEEHGMCIEDKMSWPCQTITLLATIEELQKRAIGAGLIVGVGETSKRP